MSPAVRANPCRTPSRADCPAAYSISTGCVVPGTAITGQPSEETRDRISVDRRGHDDHPQIVARLPRLARERDRQICVNAPLVKLVEHDGAE